MVQIALALMLSYEVYTSIVNELLSETEQGEIHHGKQEPEPSEERRSD